MSVLLGKAEGFECLGMRDELLYAKDPACAKVVHTAACRTRHSASDCPAPR